MSGRTHRNAAIVPSSTVTQRRPSCGPPCRIYSLLLGVLLAACGHVHVPSTTQPAPHPLLDSAGWLQDIQGSQPIDSRDQRRRAPRSAQATLIARNLDALDSKGLRDPKSSLILVRAAYDNTVFRTQLSSIRSLTALKSLSQPITGPFKTGDLVFFQEVDGVPPVGVIRRQRSDGTLEISGISRGMPRIIKAHVHRRSWRRWKGRVLNTFLRNKRPGDAKSTPYLAGQLITAIRRLPAPERSVEAR